MRCFILYLTLASCNVCATYVITHVSPTSTVFIYSTQSYLPRHDVQIQMQTPVQLSLFQDSLLSGMKMYAYQLCF